LKYLSIEEHDFANENNSYQVDICGRNTMIHDCGKIYCQNNIVSEIGIFTIEPDLLKFEENKCLIREIILFFMNRIQKLCIAITKMDTILWNLEIYLQLKALILCLISDLKIPETCFVPLDSKTAKNINARIPGSEQKCLFEIIESFARNSYDLVTPLCAIIKNTNLDLGNKYLEIKLLSGVLSQEALTLIAPINMPLKFDKLLFYNGFQIDNLAFPGSELVISVKNCELNIKPGYIISDFIHIIPSFTEFLAKIRVLKLSKNQPIISAGFCCVLHIHSLILECEITEIIRVDNKNAKFFKSKNKHILAWIKCKEKISAELFDNSRILGKFIIRDISNFTIGIGKIISYKS